MVCFVEIVAFVYEHNKQQKREQSAVLGSEWHSNHHKEFDRNIKDSGRIDNIALLFSTHKCPHTHEQDRKYVFLFVTTFRLI